MIRTATTILSNLNIKARHSHEGSQSTKCPKCSHTRRKKNAKCLKVTVDNEGVRWFCHHCNDSGGEYYESGTECNSTPTKRKPVSMSGLRGIRNATR